MWPLAGNSASFSIKSSASGGLCSLSSATATGPPLVGLFSSVPSSPFLAPSPTHRKVQQTGQGRLFVTRDTTTHHRLNSSRGEPAGTFPSQSLAKTILVIVLIRSLARFQPSLSLYRLPLHLPACLFTYCFQPACLRLYLFGVVPRSSSAVAHPHKAQSTHKHPNPPCRVASIRAQPG